MDKVKEMMKNPLVYFLGIPVLIAIWPLMLWAVYIPEVKEEWRDLATDYTKSVAVMKDILELDPERVDLAQAQKNSKEFDYAVVISNVTRACGIAPSQYDISSGLTMSSRSSNKQKFQDASVSINDVSISRIAQFYSAMQLRWSNLQCVSLKLSRKKGMNDSWDADFDFKYYY